MSALNAFFSAQSIAVVGASPHPEKVGHQIVRNLLATREVGSAASHFHLYPIHPTAQHILGLKAFPSLYDVRDPIELIIIAIPASGVIDVVDQIIERNRALPASERVKAVIIISAGFSEVSEEGKTLQHQLATRLALANIRLLGPNTLGLINPAHHLNASFAQQNIPAGNLGVISQSGAMLTALFDTLQNTQLGISFAVSLGNKADIHENDCLEFAEHDPHTDLIALYLESFSDLPHFFELTSRISKKKPILLLKGGISERGQQASASHTAALATNQVLLRAAAAQMGFVIVESVEELVNVSLFFATHRRIPEGVMVITNGGGPAVNTIDLLAAEKVTIAKWTAQSKESIATLLPGIAPNTPLDLLGDAAPERFQAALQIAQRDLHTDSLLVIITPQAVTDIPGIVNVLIKHHGRKPLLVALVGGDHLEPFRQQLRQHNIFCTAFPDESVHILAMAEKVHQAMYVREVFNPTKTYPHLLHTLAVNPHLISLSETFYLLARYGFRLPNYHIINEKNLSEVAEFNYPLFAKTANLSLLHKKEVGAIYGVVQNQEEAHTAYQKLKRFGADVLFQDVVPIDQEILIGAVRDEQFGLYMTVGLGGSYTNLLADRSYAFLPTSHHYLQQSWKKTKAYQSIAKECPESVDKIVEYMEKMQTLMEENSWIKSLEINPLIINSSGTWTTDVKIQV